MTIEKLLCKAIEINDGKEIKIFGLKDLILNAVRNKKTCKITIQVPEEIINTFLGGNKKDLGFLICISEEKFDKLKEKD